MSVSRQQLHSMIDVVDSEELSVLYHVLAKFISEDSPAPDEIEAIKAGRAEIARGETVRHQDIDWS